MVAQVLIFGLGTRECMLVSVQLTHCVKRGCAGAALAVHLVWPGYITNIPGCPFPNSCGVDEKGSRSRGRE